MHWSSPLCAGNRNGQQVWAVNKEWWGHKAGCPALSCYTHLGRDTCQLRPGCGKVPQEILPGSQRRPGTKPQWQHLFSLRQRFRPQASLNKSQADQSCLGGGGGINEATQPRKGKWFAQLAQWVNDSGTSKGLPLALFLAPNYQTHLSLLYFCITIDFPNNFVEHTFVF